MTILANVFFELDVRFSDLEKKESEKYLKKLLKPLSETLYRQEAKIYIRLEDGSLKINIAIVGALYIAIGQYGSFRSGLEFLKKDAKTIESILLNDMRKNGLSNKEIIKTKTNAGMSSSLLRLMNRVKKLKQFNSNNKEYQREIENIINYTLRLIEKTTDEDDKSLILGAVYEADTEHLISTRLPNNPLPSRDSKSTFFIQNSEEELKLISKQVISSKVKLKQPKEDIDSIPLYQLDSDTSEEIKRLNHRDKL